jgi:hypothetical protein
MLVVKAALVKPATDSNLARNIRLSMMDEDSQLYNPITLDKIYTIIKYRNASSGKPLRQ